MSSDSGPNPDPQRPPNSLEEAFETASQAAHAAVEAATQLLGEGVSPIAESPLFNFAARIPGFGWMMAAVGQVNVGKIEAEVAQLQADHPLESLEELSDRIIKSAAITAGGIGLVTNLVPPLALTLLAVDLLAVAMLQSEMIFRIAAVYGFSLKERERRGEVLAIFGVSLATSSAVKAGLSAAELLPGIGAAIGVTGNAALIYTLGNAARQFYQRKQRKP
ncbi:MAG: EcsC family protein [Synechococcales cyanobacterium CRU_2_2]|nr:EcsC family protein [Synechococcales cyanobacterium CRU_2_2]